MCFLATLPFDQIQHSHGWTLSLLTFHFILGFNVVPLKLGNFNICSFSPLCPFSVLFVQVYKFVLIGQQDPWIISVCYFKIVLYFTFFFLAFFFICLFILFFFSFLLLFISCRVILTTFWMLKKDSTKMKQNCSTTIEQTQKKIHQVFYTFPLWLKKMVPK